MKTISAIFISLLLLSITGLVGCSKSGSTIGVKPDDVEMNAAIAKARETLPQFWEKFDHPGPGEENFCLKVMIRDRQETEHFWMTDLEKKNGRTFGTISNDPDFVHNVKLGDRVEFADADISDWSYMRNGKIVGNLTLRVLFKHMSADEVKKYQAMLAEP